MELRAEAVVADKLRLLRPLGQGGMGVVWAARHLTLGTEVAVKFVRPERAVADPALVARFEREARATARISHPHVVQVMDYGLADDAVPFLVMELLRGFSLAELLERGGRLSFATAKSLVQQVGAALESAHEKGVVHRDVKPQNVFITEGSRGYPLFVKVLDFGVAKMLGDAQVPEASTLTQTGMVVGSPPYMSPEQLEGRRDTDLRSDLWSLGVIVYECLTGTQPFRGTSFVSIGAAVLRGRYQPASELRPNLPPGVDDWLAKALCLEPAGRFQSASEMVAAILALDLAGAGDPSDEGEGGATSPAAFATTVDAAVEVPDPPLAEIETTAPGGTAGHLPVAVRPEPSIVAPPRRRWPRVALFSVLGSAALASAGFAMRGPKPGCPEGMVRIDAATFAMGSDVDGETPSDETPRLTVNVGAFCLDKTEVTVKAYSACPSCATRGTVEFEGLTPNGREVESKFCNGPSAADHPMNCVDWADALHFCSTTGKRLPTEPEWELAARGKDGRPYPWGREEPGADRLNACGAECTSPWPAMYDADDGAPATAPVGRYPKGASPAGVLDLAGNVWEWTDTLYCPYRSPGCGDSRRVLRGGGWDTTERQNVRAARRYPSAPTARGKSVGFRCAKDL